MCYLIADSVLLTSAAGTAGTKHDSMSSFSGRPRRLGFRQNRDRSCRGMDSAEFQSLERVERDVHALELHLSMTPSPSSQDDFFQSTSFRHAHIHHFDLPTLASAFRLYISNRSRANKAASSPPAPAGFHDAPRPVGVFLRRSSPAVRSTPRWAQRRHLLLSHVTSSGSSLPPFRLVLMSLDSFL